MQLSSALAILSPVKICKAMLPKKLHKFFLDNSSHHNGPNHGLLEEI